MQKLPRPALCLLGALALLSLAPRPAEAMVMTYCDDRLRATFVIEPSQSSATGMTELRYQMSLLNTSSRTITYVVAFNSVFGASRQFKPPMRAAPGQQQIVLLATETARSEAAWSLIMNGGGNSIMYRTRIECRD